MIRPTKGNINLMISIEEVENILRGMMALNQAYNHKTLKRTENKTYQLGEGEEQVEFHEVDLIQLLESPLGMYYTLNTLKTGTKQDKYRIELKKGQEYWEIDND